ncbi:MAG TPA: thioredoxin family protein, partial [Gammaproteobacteria bacterium]|nr:thioredoxin family protein [Gammaproteobacteria bacterium]
MEATAVAWITACVAAWALAPSPSAAQSATDTAVPKPGATQTASGKPLPAASAARPANGPAASASARHSDAPSGIAWFQGGVDAAFTEAAARQKPVFLYWGAVWCPYCADLKAHVFSRTDFKEKLKLFVPVYLDGDDPGAQRWGDVFGIAGYPTVLALGPDRKELARIAGGMDLGLYTDMLDLVLGDLRPIDDLLAEARAATGSLRLDDCRRLAYNGWGLEDSPPTGEARLAAALDAAADRCPVGARVERARLTVLAAAYAVAADADAKADAPVHDEASKLVAALVPRVRQIVADRA